MAEQPSGSNMSLRQRFDKWLMRDFQHFHRPYTKDFKAPDWRQYKVADSTHLAQLEKALAFHGLKDPWLRNEVWRYTRVKNNGTWHHVKLTLFRGWKSGVAVGLFCYFIKCQFFPEKHHHGDEHH